MQKKMFTSKNIKNDIYKILDNINILQEEIYNKKQELILNQIALKKYNCPIYFDTVNITSKNIKIDILKIKKWLDQN
jgi:hypothetical protein